MIYVVICRHDSSSDLQLSNPFVTENYDDAVENVHHFFLDRGFIIQNGKPFDPGNYIPSRPNSGYDVFDNIKMHKGRVAQFMHCGGDGPVAEILKGHNNVKKY